MHTFWQRTNALGTYAATVLAIMCIAVTFTGTLITENQVDQMSTQPDMIKQFADYLYRVYNDSVIHTNQEDFRISSPSIHAQVYVSLNGRPSQLFISKTHALQEKKYTFAPHKWLAPFNSAW